MLSWHDRHVARHQAAPRWQGQVRVAANTERQVPVALLACYAQGTSGSHEVTGRTHLQLPLSALDLWCFLPFPAKLPLVWTHADDTAGSQWLQVRTHTRILSRMQHTVWCTGPCHRQSHAHRLGPGPAS
jgi:hypothetical protein